MTPRHREEGISEAIGFILILAAIIITLSIYLLYLMPTMGREDEIAQMSAVKERFTEYKLNIDTLWTSRQCTSEYGPALSLGSGEKTGILSYFPFFSPARAGAILALNQRAENITIASDSYILAGSGGYSESQAITNTPSNLNVNATPGHFYINISTSDLLTERGVLIDGPSWDIWVNITPNYFYTNRFNWTLNATGYITNFWNWTEYQWNSTDVTVDTYSGGSPVVSDLPVYRGISTSTTYTVDLMSPVYGISTQFQNPQSISVKTSDASGMITASSDMRYGFTPVTSSSTQPLGSIEYRSNNLYYTPQTYYYQLGGVFLEQSDGSTNEIPPAISISMVNGSPVVNVGEILLLGGVASTQVSGSGPITVTSAVTDITRAPLPTGNNTRWVNLSIQTVSTGAAEMWNKTLTGLAAQGGLPVSAYTSGTAGNVAFMNITGNPQIYDIQLSLTQVNVSADYVEEYSPGGISRSWRNVPGFSLPGSTTTIPTTTTTITPTPTPNPPWYCGWAYRKNITIDKAKVSGSQADFPVLISLPSDSGLAAYAQANGNDILFTRSDGVSKLSHQIESYTSGTGALVAWVKVLSLSSSENTTLYMYYGNPSAPDQSDRTNVWDTSYKAVWHLSEGGTGTRYDSTSSSNNLNPRNYDSNEAAAGKIDGSDYLQGTDDYLESANNIGITGTAYRTISFWVNLQNTNRCGMVGWGTRTAGGEYEAGVRGNNYFLWEYGGGGYDWDTGVTAQTLAWHYHVITYSGTRTRWYVDGSQLGSGHWQSLSTGNSHVFIGYEYDPAYPSETWMNGIIDEVRISSAVRTTSWMQTEYNNQYSPGTFHYVNPPESYSC